MAIKKSQPDKQSTGQALGFARKVEEVDFHDYLKTKKSRRYMEEVGIADHLKKKKRRPKS
jgi:hypothetical protein